MTITVRQLRKGTVVRLTGAHAQAFNGLLLNLLERDEAVIDVMAAAELPAVAPNRVPERSETVAGAGAAAGAPNAS